MCIRDRAGTGPYVMTEHRLAESISYEKAPGEHWAHPVDWNGLKMTWVLEEATRLAQFKAGETHLTEVNKDLTDKLIAEGYKMVKSTGPAQQVQINFTGNYYGTEDESRDKFMGITGKLTDHPFTNQDVRQAINKAIDRETLKEELYKGRVQTRMSTAIMKAFLDTTRHGKTASKSHMVTTLKQPKRSWRRQDTETVSALRRGCSHSLVHLS